MRDDRVNADVMPPQAPAPHARQQAPVRSAGGRRRATPAPEAPGTAEATPELSLNAAEKLFAAHGFESTSVRAIASEAGVNLGTLHYYWGSKNGLIRAVLERRLKPVLADRKARYESLLRAAGSKPVDIHALLEACLVPALLMPGADTAQRQSFRRLYGQALADPSEAIRAIVDELYDESSRIFLDALRRCCAHLEDDEFYWRLTGILGTLLYSQLGTGRLTRLSRGSFTDEAIEDGLPQLVAFAAAGMMAPSIKRPTGTAPAAAARPGASTRASTRRPRA